MHPHGVTSEWDVYLLGIPLLALLFFGYFRLDEVFTSKKTRQEPPSRTVPTVEAMRDRMGTDPDGTPWEKRSPRRR